jgi:hypothetical protein
MNNNDRKYNGWTNYETWRVNLEIFDGISGEDFDDIDHDIDHEWCKEYESAFKIILKSIRGLYT